MEGVRREGKGCGVVWCGVGKGGCNWLPLPCWLDGNGGVRSPDQQRHRHQGQNCNPKLRQNRTHAAGQLNKQYMNVYVPTWCGSAFKCRHSTSTYCMRQRTNDSNRDRDRRRGRDRDRSRANN